MDAQRSPTKDEQKHYTALVYFHGIGEQRRYEEVSFLIDALDRYEREIECKFQGEAPLCNKIDFQFEPLRRLEESDLKRERNLVGYNRVLYNGQEFRFYEAYYADLTASGIRPTEVFRWLLKLTMMPVRMLFTQWRDLARLRRATLLSGWKNRSGKLGDLSAQEVGHLLKVYDDFVHFNQPPEFPNRGLLPYLLHRLKNIRDEGSFKQYLDYLADPAYKAETRDSNQVRRNARQWQRRFIGVQIRIAIIVLTFLLILGLISMGLVAFVVQIPSQVLPLWLNFLMGTVILLSLWGVGAFLRNYVGDLYFWTTYQETSEKHRKREEILDRCCTYLTHVLLDKNCDRVVLVGHSMGTTVAHDTILRLARAKPQAESNGRRPRKLRLDKIQHFVTLASVVDKVYYLFESVTSKSFRYTRIIDSVRKDLGEPPFSEKAGRSKPRIHWINFWDRADVASSALYTPANHEFHPDQVVDNCEVAGKCFPDPASAHSDYLKNPIVLKGIFEVFFDNKYSFVDGSKERPVNYQEQFIGTDQKMHWITNLVQASVLLFPWLILLYLIFRSFNPGMAGSIILPALALYFFLIVAFGFLDWFLRFRRSDISV